MVISPYGNQRREHVIGYKNGRDVLPPQLLEQLQEYIAGELIYIPKKDNTRKRWGELSGTRQAIQKRNREIIRRHENGESIPSLAAAYYLSEDSIRKIVLYRKTKSGSSI